MLTNPVIISVVLMSALCLAKFPVLLALLVSAIVAGLTAGIPLGEVMGTLVGGMGGNANTALSYILLGTLAACFTQTDAAAMIPKKFSRLAGDRKFVLLGIFLVTSILSQNLIPVHIAFIPILVPPLLSVMNKMTEEWQLSPFVSVFWLHISHYQ